MPDRNAAVGALVLLGICGAARAQCAGAWSFPGFLSLGPRESHAMVFDAARTRVTEFGGFSTATFGFNQETWVYSGVDWTQVNVGGPAPSPRAEHAMVYDSTRQRIILFGGFDGAVKNDTWEWNGSAWSQVSTTGAPTTRRAHSMAYDSARARVVLFGGQDQASAIIGDTWEYNPATATWTQIMPAAAPSARFNSAMVFDSARGVSVLYGGETSMGFNNNTWEWDGAAWNPIFGAAPPARASHAMIYDAARHVTVLFGGTLGASLSPDTWERGSGAWSLVSTPSPGARYEHAMAYDSVRSAAVMFGGSNGNGSLGDLWERLCPCYANCDASTVAPVLNIADFVCFLNRFAANDPYANCDGSTVVPTLNIADFSCFLNRFGAGC